MDVDIAQLASQVATFLIPYLVKGGEAIAGETGKKIAQALWEKFKPKVEAKGLAKEALQDLKATPEDEDAQASMRQQIKKILLEDPSFASEISVTIGNFDASMQAGDNSVLIRGNVGRNFVQGDRNIIAEQLQIIFEQKQITSPVEQQKAEKAYRSYLEKLRRFCNALPLAALGGEESSEEDITLDKIYIDLDTTQFKETLEQASEKEKKLGVSGVVARLDKMSPISVMEAATTNKRLVLLGEAGAGKSTFVKELLALQAAVLLGERKVPLEGFDSGLIPVLIVLRELSPRLGAVQMGNPLTQNQKQDLSDAVLEKIRQDISSYRASEFIPVLEDAIENGSILLVLDGLDEVPQDLRGRVRQAVGALIQIHQIERIIITCRSRSYIGPAVFANFQPFAIAPFNEEKISQFARAWYIEQHRLGRIQADHAEKRADDLANAATAPDLMEMSGNPMMLTSIAIIHQKDIGLPRERVRLYQLIVDVLVSRWQKYKMGDEEFAPSSALAEFLKNDILLRATLERLAYETHRIGSKAENKNVEIDLSRSQALMLLETSEYLGSIALASEFLDYVDQRAGLLVGKGGELEYPTSYSFPHRTVQEYLAGCYLIGKRERGREYYNHAAEGDFWSLAAIMGAEELFYNRRSTDALLDLAYYLCPSDPLRTEQDERSLLWSGQIANILGNEAIERDTGNPSGGNAYLQRLIPRTVDLLESQLTPRERAEAGDTLAKLGDPRFDEKHWYLPNESLFGFVHIPAGEFLMGTRKEDIKGLIEKFGGNEDLYKAETPQHPVTLPDYYISRFPVTVAQFKAFVEESGHKSQDEDSIRGVPNHPVVYVTWYDALAYCKWLKEKLKEKAQSIVHSVVELPNEREESFWQGLSNGKLVITLPSEAEWEKAARGVDGHVFPWRANEIAPNLANYRETNINRTSAVGCFPQGKSPYEIEDMSGNVWEWTRSEFKEYPFDPKAKLEKIEDVNVPRVLRGGAFNCYGRRVRCAYRDWDYPYLRNSYIGFRVVVASPISLSDSGS